jgi:predicted RNA polymerase sigma factor
VRFDLMDEAIHLARMLRELVPDEREVQGLLALLLVTNARRNTRMDAEIEHLERDGALQSYQYLHAIKADLLHRQGRSDEAGAAYRSAFELARNEAERAFLAERVNGRTGQP